MRFHAIVLAAMSAGALSVSLIQKDPTNSKGLPNVSCEGKDAGKKVHIDFNENCPSTQPDCNCYRYDPPAGSYLQVYYDHWQGDTATYFSIAVFSDTECTEADSSNYTLLWPSDAYMELTANFDCVYMGEGVQWGSVMVGPTVPDPGTTSP